MSTNTPICECGQSLDGGNGYSSHDDRECMRRLWITLRRVVELSTPEDKDERISLYDWIAYKKGH